jgi:ribosome maturation factor RimP
MTLNTLEQNLTSFLEKLFVEQEMTSCFLVDLVLKGKKIEVYLDSDDAITFGICREVSRHLESFLDESDILGDDYLLEVSSAGVGNPLKFPRQFIKNKGKLILITNKEGEQFAGKLTHADGTLVTIEWSAKEKVGKKNVLKEYKKDLIYSDIEKAIVKISI